MPSLVLLPILRASITLLRTFHQRSLLPSDVNCASISQKSPALSGDFLWITSASFDVTSPKKLCFFQGVYASCINRGFGENLCNLFRANSLFVLLVAYLFLPIRTMRGFRGQANAWKGVWIPSWIRLPIGWALALSSFIAGKNHLIVLMSQVSLRR